MRLRCHASMAVLLVLAPAAADQLRTDAEPCRTPPTVRQLSPDTPRLAQVADVRSSTDRLSAAIEVVFRLYRHEGSGVALANSQSKRLPASAYSHGGKLLLAAQNDTDEAQAASLQLDLAKLGAKAGARGSDVWNPGKTYELASQWQDTIPPRGFRLVLWGD